MSILGNCSSLKSIFPLPHIWKTNDITESEGAGGRERGGIERSERETSQVWHKKALLSAAGKGSVT